MMAAIAYHEAIKSKQKWLNVIVLFNVFNKLQKNDNALKPG